jgi:uncharacterized membrane protein YjgN (DUF898 family)
MDASVPGTPAGSPGPIDITFENRSDRLIGLGAVNGVLKLLSLGIYSFWGKTEVRKRLWSFTRLNGEPLEYTGTGKELFLGFIIVFFVFVLPIMIGALAVALLFPKNQLAISIYQIAAYGLFFLLLGNAMYRAQRYRLSRTQWRGIRGALVGSPARYGWTYFWTLAAPFAIVAGLSGIMVAMGLPALASAVALLGFIAALWVLPWRSNLLQRLITSDMRFGDRPLTYTGGSGPLYKRYFFAWAGSAILYVGAIAATAAMTWDPVILQGGRPKPPNLSTSLALVAMWLFVIIASGLITAWYRANQLNHFAAHTHLDTATFRMATSGKGIMWLLFSNGMLSVLGILLGLFAGGALAYAAGLLPEPPPPGVQVTPPVLAIVTMLAPIVVMTTIATTFAQLRSARYFLSRLKLDGPVDLAAIQQNASALPKRGEGLAQVFDLDAF